RLLPGRIAPMLWSIGAPPRLLLPAELLGVLSEEQLDTLLVHELAHLRRRDHWVRVLEFVVMGLYWWHPVVWYARRELREAEEQCCDAWVVSTLPGTGRTYASALLDTLDFLSTTQAAVPPLASGLGQIADLKRRLTMIMRENTPRSLTWPGCFAVVALGLTFLPMLPSLHGQLAGREGTEQSDADLKKAEAEVEQARQRWARLQSLLELKKAELSAAKADLMNAEVQAQLLLRNVESKAQRLKIIRQEQAAIAKDKKKAIYRIEITLPADGSVDPVQIFYKIQKLVPEKLHGGMAVRHVTEKQNSLLMLPLEKAPTKANDQVTKPPQKSSDTRINDLEKKLEKVLQELHELRKKMKESPTGGEFSPGPNRIAPRNSLPRP
ncbi:MAG: M56 family metallopeptidase, partial [Gemmataceae bacterium]